MDVIYIAASAQDTRFTRICVASIRALYPTVPIRLLAGGRLARGLARELRAYWNVAIADIPPGDYGWGFVKLEPLFGSTAEKFLMLDSDTVLAGPLLEACTDHDVPFIVDDESQSEADAKRLYYDWDGLRAIDPLARRPQFVFNSGQWFGTAGVLSRDDFSPWVEWSMPRRLRHPNLFMPGDQGVLNYVLNQKVATDGLQVARRRIMRWPGRPLDDLDVDAVSRRLAPPVVVHWAGVKRLRHRDMNGAGLLSHFEARYYSRIPRGRLLGPIRALRETVAGWFRHQRVRVRLAWRRITASTHQVTNHPEESR